MVKKRVQVTSQAECDHQKGFYTERCFDVLNGFELVFTRCIDCHKIVELETKKLQTN